MRIILVQNSVYLPALGGANKSNRLLLEELAARGHDCAAVAPACSAHGCATRVDFHAELQNRGLTLFRSDAEGDTFDLAGVRVTAATSRRTLTLALLRAIREQDPDCVVVASEDPGQALLEAALEVVPERVVYLARTTLALPCGPDAAIRDPERARLLSRAASVVVVSQYLRAYLARWAGIEPTELPICPNGSGPFPDYGLANAGAILMVNPCAYKGLPIFRELARTLPDLPFTAVPTWGTTRADRAALLEHRNVGMLEPAEDMDRIFASTRVLLVPSLWAEAKANVITEAMLRGIPVLASDTGGNGEAMLGVDYLLPVAPITHFAAPLTLDERMLPVVDVPPQDVRPWREALMQLLATPSSYQRVSRAARTAALAANVECTVGPFEQHLEQIRTARSRAVVSS